jgi:alcohol dehydrogenase (cytochrome c)/quinohemoprotein ethanol dehydrogenase
MNRTRILGLCALLSLSLLGCQKAKSPDKAQGPAANVTADRLLKATDEPSQWLTHGGSYEEQRYSRLAQVNRETVKTLGLSWFADYDTNLAQAGTPLYIDGVLYVSTAWSKVYAFDAKTGKALWQYDPKVPGEWGINVCCGLVNRGVAAWNGKIYVGTLDGRLVALDARTGAPVWSMQTTDNAWRYAITGAPRVVKGKVLIGNAGGENDVRGYVSAYDAETGKQLWRFYTVPGDPSQPPENDAMKMAAATWPKTGDWWKIGGGGTVWDAITYDPVSDLVYIGTGNGTPWNQRFRDAKHGDNLFLTSIVALKPDTGEYVWHYQQTPGDNWDFDATPQIMVANLKIDAADHRVVMQASKNGFFYVLDAAKGTLLRADAFTEMNWATGVDKKTGRPIENKAARYQDGKPFNGLPGPQGGHTWHPMSYSPDTGLVYIPAQEAYFPWVEDPKYTHRKVGYNLGIDFGAPGWFYQKNPKEKNAFQSYVKAWDPVAGKEAWRGEVSQGPAGGTLATAGGLVFQSGGTSQEFRAYDAKTGEKLWHLDAQTGLVAGAISYELDGRQYVAVSVGGNMPGGYFAPNYSRLLVLSLGGKAVFPPLKDYTPPPLAPPANTAAPEVVAAGAAVYGKYCAACHGVNGQTRGATFPDLTRTPLLHTQEGFNQVVLQGARAAKGMVSFATELKAEDSAAVLAYLVDRATQMKSAPPPPAGLLAPREAPKQAHE